MAGSSCVRLQVGLSAALGGATSNLIDRFRHGAVIDFIDLGFWPVFNLADVAIVFGLAAVFLSLW
jgi:signal peptidase II